MKLKFYKIINFKIYNIQLIKLKFYIIIIIII